MKESRCWRMRRPRCRPVARSQEHPLLVGSVWGQEKGTRGQGPGVRDQGSGTRVEGPPLKSLLTTQTASKVTTKVFVEGGLLSL